MTTIYSMHGRTVLRLWAGFCETWCQWYSREPERDAKPRGSSWPSVKQVKANKKPGLW